MCIVINSTVDTKLGGVSNTTDDRIRIQRGLDRLELCAESNKMKFNKGKSKADIQVQKNQ